MRLMNQNFCAESATVITASSEDPSFPASNLKHPFRSKRIRSATGTTTLNIVFDVITTENIDSVVLLWSKEDGIRLSGSAVVKIQANATNVWTSPAVDQTLTIDNTYMTASHYFTTNQNYRYWRVVIQDAGNPYGYVELGIAWLGKGLTIDNAQNGFQFSLVDGTKTTVNDFGHMYGDEYPTKANLQFSYKVMEYDEVQILEDAFRANGIRKPVLMALDPEAGVFNKDHFTVYGMFKNSFGLNHRNYNILDTDGITVTEIS